MLRYLTDVDMNRNEMKNARFHNSSEAPKNPGIGQIYTDISGEVAELKWWNGKEWIPLGGTRIPESYPTKVEPSVSISLSNIDTSNLEVGSSTSVPYVAKFNPGSYTYGPATGVTVTSWRIYDDYNESSAPEGTFEVTVGDDTSYSIKVEASHSAGVIPVTDQGSPYPAAQILEGVKRASTESLSGFRKYFYGATTEILEMNSDSIRSLTHSTKPIAPDTSFDLKIPEGATQVIIAIPSSAGLTLSSVLDTGAFNINVYDVFDKLSVNVEGANGYEAVSYDVYVYEPDASLSSNLYKVTITE